MTWMAGVPFLAPSASALRALPEVVDFQTLQIARPVLAGAFEKAEATYGGSINWFGDYAGFGDPDAPVPRLLGRDAPTVAWDTCIDQASGATIACKLRAAVISATLWATDDRAERAALRECCEALATCAYFGAAASTWQVAVAQLDGGDPDSVGTMVEYTLAPHSAAIHATVGSLVARMIGLEMLPVGSGTGHECLRPAQELLRQFKLQGRDDSDANK